MADTMTLEQVLFEARLVANNGCMSITRKNCAEWANAIDAAIKQRDKRDAALARLLSPGLRVYVGDYAVQIDAGKLGLFTERFADAADKPRALQVVREAAIHTAMASGNG